jgi:hypothetical protein
LLNPARNIRQLLIIIPIWEWNTRKNMVETAKRSQVDHWKFATFASSLAELQYKVMMPAKAGSWSLTLGSNYRFQVLRWFKVGPGNLRRVFPTFPGFLASGNYESFSGIIPFANIYIYTYIIMYIYTYNYMYIYIYI